MMKCVMCDNLHSLKGKRAKMKYKECGLDNVTLYGVECFKCNRCGEEYTGYGDQEQLHAVIAGALISKKGKLTGEEVRFLRTYLGYSGAYFAKLTGYRKETISRFENNKHAIPIPFDRLVRSLVANKLPDRRYDLHELWLNEAGESFSRIEISAEKGKWHLAKLAA